MSSSPDETTHLTDPTTPASAEFEMPVDNWDKYKIEALLGEGGMARVYKAFDPQLNRFVALKFIRTDDETLRKRLLREARSQAQIDDDHVCKIYEVGEVAGKSFIAMQLVQGGTLQELLPEMSLDQKVLLMQRVADAIQSAHKMGIIHRDLKPSNIMIERKEDGSYRPSIVDFGIARKISDPHLTATDAFVGTPAFMAPEQVIGNPDEVDRRTDVYALGATLYYALSGQFPFQGQGLDLLVNVTSKEPVPLKRINPKIPEDLDVIVSKCLEKEMLRRYDSARALSDDLKRYLAGEPITAKRTTIFYRFNKSVKRNKTVAAMLSVAVLLILVLAAFGISTYWRTSRQVEIARQLSQSVEAMDWIMRVAYMAPLHDTGKEKQEVLQRMKEIEAVMKRAGSAGVGPGNFALARGFLALQDYDKARMHLQKAWDANYRGPDVAGALGLTLGALYKRSLTEADRISDRETRKVRLQEIEKEYRDPAVQHLRTGSGVGSQFQQYGEGLISYYERNWNRALELARKSAANFPRLYEARMLEGDVYVRQGEEAYAEGNFDMAKKRFEAAAVSYARAGETARSDPALYENLCLLWRSIMETEIQTGKESAQSYEQSKSNCRNALQANPESANAYELIAQTEWRWGEDQFTDGLDPTKAFHASIESSQKAQRIRPERGFPFYTHGTALGFIADYKLRVGQDPTGVLEESIRILRIAIQKDPSFASSHTNLGVSYYTQGALAAERGQEPEKYFLSAIDAYQKALEVSPKDLPARANIANAFNELAKNAMKKGKDPTHFIQQGIEHYDKALAINPNHWMIRSNLATIYLSQMEHELNHGKDPHSTFEKLIVECRKSEELNPGNAYSPINRGDAHIFEAEYFVRKKEDPTDWIKKGEESYASVEDAELPEVFLGLAHSRRLVAEYKIQQKQSPLEELQRSSAQLDRAFQVNPAEHLIPLERAELELIRADWLSLQKKSAQEALLSAEKHIAKCLEINPQSAFAYEKLARIHLKKGNMQPGLSAIEKSLQLNPDSGFAHITKARLLLLGSPSKSNAEQAMKSLETGFRINPLLEPENRQYYLEAKSSSRPGG